MTDPAEVAPAKDAPTGMASLEVQRLKAAARAKLFGESSAPLQISRYTILRQLGVGGMGEVFLAYDAELARKVAIKLVRLDRDRAVERASSRLLREAQALARLSHPNVVQVYEVGHFEGRVFIAMEFVHGVHMRRWLEAAPRSWRQILDMYLQAGQGLAAAHRLGMVHRDFKPENILVGDDGRVRVVDFGLVRNAPDAAQPDLNEGASAEDLERSSRLTQSGALMGTPTYMSPEQFQRLKATAKSDQFAFCVALYRGLYGWHPFAAETRVELKRRVLSGQVAAPPREAKVPTAIYTVLLRGLQVDPEQRYPSMEALLTALAAPPRRRLGTWAATAGAAAFGALVAWFAWPDGPGRCSPDAPIDGWGPAQRERLLATFAATDLPYAAGASEHALGRLDRYAAALQARRAEVCAAPLDQPWLAARQSACLDRRARELAVVAGALAEARAPLVEDAALLVESLPSIAPCDDLEVLAGGPAPPADATAAEARGWLDEARIFALRGEFEDAERRAEHALERATRLEDGPLLAEVRATLARVHDGREAHEQADAALHDALDLAETHRHDELTAELWLTLTRRAVERGDVAADGLAHARRAAAAIRRLDDTDRGAELELLRGELLLQLQQFTPGEMALQTALNAPERPALAIRAELQLGRTLLDQNRLREAREHLERGLQRLGAFPRHPDVAAFLEQFARLYQREGRVDQAREQLQLALQIRANHPHRPGPLARVHLAVADLAAGSGDLAAAREHYNAALRLAEQHPRLLTAAERARAEAGRADAARP